MASERIISPYRGVIVQLVTKQAMTALIAVAPFLSFPPLAYMTNVVMSWLVGFILDYTILGINLVYVIGETAYDLYAFKVALAEYAEAKKAGRPEGELDVLEKEIIKRGFELIDLNGRRL